MTTSTLTPDEQRTADAEAAADGLAAPAVPIDHFGERASDETIERTAEALRAKGYGVHVVQSGDEARKVVLDLLPEGAEVGQGALAFAAKRTSTSDPSGRATTYGPAIAPSSRKRSQSFGMSARSRAGARSSTRIVSSRESGCPDRRAAAGVACM